MRRLALSTTMLLAVLLPGIAHAGPPRPERVVLPPGSLHAEGAVVVDGARARVHCDRTEPFEPAAACTIESHATLTAGDAAVVLSRTGDPSASIVVGGSALSPEGTRTLAAGTSVDVTIETRVALPVERDYRDGVWIVPAIYARHALLSDGPTITREATSVESTLVEGPSVTYREPLVVDDAERAHVQTRVADDAAGIPRLTLGVDVTRLGDAVVQHGGPVLGLGLRETFREGDGGRFLLTLGYELGLFEHLVASVAIETDFASLMESVVIEIGSPELIVVAPSVSTGVGVVLRQLGDRDADAALRLRVGANVFGLGANVDFDYWPTIGDWTLSASGRVSF
jgi:hypothetical protein